jgi:hypothetical protein
METKDPSTVITPRHARGLCRQYARERSQTTQVLIEKCRRGKGKSVLRLLRDRKQVFATRRRPPSQDFPAGIDTVELMTKSDSGALALMLDHGDKYGIPILSTSMRLLLELSKHATESLYQRLRTYRADVVIDELRPVGKWLLDNLWAIGLVDDGLFLTPTGVFPVTRGEPFKTKDVDGRYHWIAPTWIADAGLAENGQRKRRVADTVRSARAKGLRVGLIQY